MRRAAGDSRARNELQRSLVGGGLGLYEHCPACPISGNSASFLRTRHSRSDRGKDVCRALSTGARPIVASVRVVWTDRGSGEDALLSEAATGWLTRMTHLDDEANADRMIGRVTADMMAIRCVMSSSDCV
jgi:hypothetical protein